MTSNKRKRKGTEEQHGWDFFELAPVPYQSLNEEGEILQVNKAWLDKLGYDRKEVEGEWFGKFVTEESREAFPKLFSQFKERGELHDLEFTIKKKDGERITVLFDGRVGYPNGNGSLRTFCVFRDITARKKMERKLSKRNAAIESSISAIALADLDGNLTFVNSACIRMWGYETEEEILGEHVTKFWQAPEKREEVMEALWEEGGWEGKLFAKRKDGSSFWVRLSATLVKNESEEPIALMGSFLDVTELVKAREELQKHRNQLEELVEERTVDLERANEQLEEMFQLISHDLREPLRTVGSYSDLIRINSSDQLDEKSLYRLDRIKKSVQRMKDFLHDLSDLARMGKSSEIESKGKITMAKLVEEIKGELSGSYPEAQIEVMDEFPPLRLNVIQLRMIIRNLISNGVKYNSPPRTVKIGHERRDQEGVESLVVFVRDNGWGIREEYQEKIFDMFERLEPEGEIDGTGAGLAICKRIVESHGGEIWVESEPGVGSTFYFTLPWS